MCDDGWTELNSDVVCQQLGYVRANKNTPSIRPSSANRQSWQSRVACNGTESNVSQCNLTEWKNATCGSDQGIAISCSKSCVCVCVCVCARDMFSFMYYYHLDAAKYSTMC